MKSKLKIFYKHSKNGLTSFQSHYSPKVYIMKVLPIDRFLNQAVTGELS